MRTYTEHKLTDAQLRRLSALVNQGKLPRGQTGGVAGDALVRKGLIAVDDRPEIRFHSDRLSPTDSGRAALAQARREGW